jgi:tyrosyl-DNA phosphodiesterase-1
MIVTCKDKPDEITDDTVLYFGSHNFSGGAWGNLEKNDSQIAISNWEIGVVFPPGPGTKDMKVKMVNSMVLKFPPVKY